jgi:hypothetical protein
MPPCPVLKLGTWLEGLDEEVQREAESLCRVLTSCFTDAVLALTMFEQCMASDSFEARRAKRDRDQEAQRVREQELEAKEAGQVAPGDYHKWRTELYDRARQDVLQARWQEGELPDEYLHRLPFIHARTFLTTLARVERAMWALAKLDLDGAESNVASARSGFEAALPGLKGVRDSIEHAEDRMRGRGRGGRALTLQPINNRLVNTPGGGVLIGDALNGRHFGCTIEDGTYAEVEVSADTLEVARVALQAVFDALPWMAHGYPSYVPR